MYKYTDGEKNSSASNIKQLNLISTEYSTGSNAVNFITNSNMESSSNWTPAAWNGTNNFSISYDTSQYYFGKKSIKINVTSYEGDSRGRVYQDVSNTVLIPGHTYTLSGYIKTVGVTNGSTTNSGAVLCADSFNSDGTSTTNYSDFVFGNTSTSVDNGWQRVNVTFTVPSNSTKTRINLALRKSTGTAYFDGIQLEEYSVMNDYNMLENSGLEKYSSNGLPTGWFDEYSNLNTSTDCSSTSHTQGSTSFRFKGVPGVEKGICQTVNVSGTENDTYIVSGWSKANAVPKDEADLRKYKISIQIKYIDNSSDTGFSSVWKGPAEFNYSISDWQYSSVAFNLSDNKKDTNLTPISIKICLRYQNQSNYAYYDNICLVKDNAQSYTYDDDGKLISVVANSDEKSENITSITDANGAEITSATHIGNLNPFRYRGYYQDSESGFYYLMSRYYDPVTHRFINADGYFQSGSDVLDTNMHAYCSNNPVNFSDPTGEHGSKNPCGDPTCFQCRPDYKKFVEDNPKFIEKCKNTGNWTPRKDSRKGSEERQKGGNRERNVSHPNGEEHSRAPKGNGIKKVEPAAFEYAVAIGLCAISAVAIIYLVANDITGVGVADDAALIPTVTLFWESAQTVF